MRQTQFHLFRLASAFILAALPVSWLTGCAWTHGASGVIYENDDGVIYLEEIQNPEFRASHPAKLEQATIARLLAGIRVEQNIGSTGRFKASGKHSLPVFSEEQIQFLSPLLTAALAKAQPQQWVIFRRIEAGSSPPKVTAGALYAHGPTLYVTLTHLRDGVPESKASKASAGLEPSTKAERHVFYFVPEVAGRLADSLPPGAPDLTLLSTLAIDVERLANPSSPPVQQVGPGTSDGPSNQAAMAPAQQPQPPEVTTPAEIEAAKNAYRVKLKELQDTNRLLGQRMAENQALQEDLRILREKLAEHRALVDQLKQRKKKVR